MRTNEQPGKTVVTSLNKPRQVSALPAGPGKVLGSKSTDRFVGSPAVERHPSNPGAAPPRRTPEAEASAVSRLVGLVRKAQEAAAEAAKSPAAPPAAANRVSAEAEPAHQVLFDGGHSHMATFGWDGGPVIPREYSRLEQKLLAELPRIRRLRNRGNGTLRPAPVAIVGGEFAEPQDVERLEAVGEHLRWRATILNPGRRFTVVESEVVAAQGDEAKLVAKGIFTIAIVGERSGDA